MSVSLNALDPARAWGDKTDPAPGEAGLAAEPSCDIVLFSSSFCMGGLEAHLIDLAKGLRRGGWRVALICSTRPDIEPLRERLREVGVHVHTVAEAGNVFQLIPRARHLVRVLQLHPGCVVHLHLQGDSGGTLMLLASKIARVAAVVRTLHNPPVPPITRRLRRVVQITDRLLNRVICVSPETKREHVEKLGRNPEKLVVIPHGVDLARFSHLTSRAEVRRELSVGKDEILVGTVARLAEKRKGMAEFVEMAALLAQRRPKVRFIVVGDGPLRQELEKQAARLGLAGRLLFTGHREDVQRLMVAMDVAVFPSSYEAGPYVMLEAMAMSRAVVITPTGLAVDMIKPGVNGVLVPFHDPAATSEAVERLLADPATAARMGEAAREMVVKGYSTELMIDALAGVYRELAPPAMPALVHSHDQASTA